MSALESELQSLQRDVVLALTGSASLEDVLSDTLEALQRHLGVASATVFVLPVSLEERPPTPWVSLRGASPLPVDAALLGLAARVHGSSACEQLAAQAGAHSRELFTIPGYGLLELRRAGMALAPEVVDCVRDLMVRLGRIARACGARAASEGVSEHSLAEAEYRRFAAALLQLSRQPTEALLAFIRSVTELLGDALAADRVSVWHLLGDQLRCVDLFTRADRRHQGLGLGGPEATDGGFVLKARDFPPYFAALATFESIVADQASSHPATACFTDVYLRPLGITSMLDTPLRSLSGGVRGVVCVESFAARSWRPAEVRFCEEASALLVQATDRADRRHLEARYAVMLASIGDGVVGCDMQGGVTVLNSVAELLTGWRQEHALGRPLEEVFRTLSPATRAPRPAPLAVLAATGEVRELGGRSLLLRRDGVEIPISSSAAAVVEHGVPLGVVLTFRDVSEEEAARRAIELQNRQLRSLNAAIPDLLFTVTTEGRLRYSKDAESPDLLVPADDVHKHTVEELFPPALAAEILAAVRQAVTLDRLQTVEYPLDLPAGRQWFEARFSRMGEEEATVLVRNVTAERTRQEALQVERERLEAVLATTSAIIYVARLPDFQVEYVSESASAVLGFSADEFRAPGFWRDAVHPEDGPRVLAELERVYIWGHHVHEYRHRHRDGSYRWLRDELRLVRDAHGRPDRVVGASFDITERKLGEGRLTAVLAVQKLVSQVSAGFLGLDAARTQVLMQEALGGLGAQVRADRAYVFQLRDGRLDNTHEWCAPGVDAQIAKLQALDAADFAFFMAPIVGGQPLYIPSVPELPAEAAGERELLSAQGIESLLAVPLLVEGQLRGFIGVDNPRFDPLGGAQLSEYTALLQLFADTVASGQQRLEDEAALRTLNRQLSRQTEQQRALLVLSAELARAEDRAALLQLVRARLRGVLGVERVALSERAEGADLHRLVFLDQLPEPRGPAAAEPSPPAEAALDIGHLGGTAVAEAIESGEAITTRDRAVDGYRDWRQLRTALGYEHFIVVPLLGAEGAFGTLTVGLGRGEPPSGEEVARVAQFGSLLSAHLSIQRGREALQELNAALETRVDERTRALRSSEERFENLFQHAPQAMVIVDGAQRVIQCNANARSLFGYGEADFQGLPVERLVPEGARGRHGQHMASFRASAQARPMSYDRAVQALRSDGSLFSAEIGLVPLPIEGEVQVLAGITDISERLAAQEAVSRSLREKETLLKEIHHRVKNNLQIISSLLMLQRDQMPSEEARTLLEESVFRVRSMALIHQQLYGVDSLERVDLGDYARALTESLRAALAPGALIDVRTTPAELTVDLAVPLGLILNEFLTNAFKYGLPAGRGPRPPGRLGPGRDLLVEVGGVDGQVRVAVTDSGPGLPPDFDPVTSPTLGLQLVRSLNRQLRGQLSVDSHGGTCFAVVCPIPEPSAGHDA